MSATYRDENEGLNLQIETLRERYHEEIESLAEPLRRLYGRRYARMLAGKVAIFGAALLALVTAFILLRAGSFELPWYSERRVGIFTHGWLTPMLLAVLATVVIAYAFGLLPFRGELPAKLARAIPLTGDAHRDLAQLEDVSPLLELRRLLLEQGRRSISLPLVGALMLLPITLHFAVYTLFGALGGVLPPLDRFDQWIAWSVVFATPAHLVTIYMGSRLPRHLAERYAAGERCPSTKAGLTVFLAAAASLIPGASFAMNSPDLVSAAASIAVFLAIIVALTSSVVVIPAFYVARQRFLAERELLAA